MYNSSENTKNIYQIAAPGTTDYFLFITVDANNKFFKIKLSFIFSLQEIGFLLMLVGF